MVQGGAQFLWLGFSHKLTSQKNFIQAPKQDSILSTHIAQEIKVFIGSNFQVLEIMQVMKNGL